MMRKSFTLLLAIVLVLPVMGQNLRLKRGTTDYSHASIYVSGTPSQQFISAYITVENTSGAALDVKVRKTEVQVIGGSENTFCWGVCYLPTVFTSPMHVTIPANSSDSTSFIGDYSPTGQTGTSIVRYTFYNAQNALSDTVSLTVYYQANSSGIENLTAPKPWFRVYPNPVDQQVSVKFSVLVQGKVESNLINIQGQVILSKKLSASQRDFRWDTGRIPAGIYFLEARDENGWRSVQKVWVRH